MNGKAKIIKMKSSQILRLYTTVMKSNPKKKN